MKFVHKFTSHGEDNGIWLYKDGYCYNRYGGRHLYTPNILDEFYEASGWAEVFKEILLKNRDKYITGWIAPDGEFFGCPPASHDDIAYYLFDSTQTELEEKGYIKVYEVPPRLNIILNQDKKYDYFGRPTVTQELTLERLGIK